MAITDNTAKWQVKKLTNFTDKDREIATQAQAEEGVDNTKVMTPLRVKQAVAKCDAKNIVPVWIQDGTDLDTCTDVNFLYQSDGSGTYLNNPIAQGVAFTLEVLPWGVNNLRFMQRITDASPKTNVYVRSRSGGGGFNAWKKIFNNSDITPQSQAEAGTDNTTVMTPLRTKQLGDKNYLPLSGGVMSGQIGFSQKKTTLYNYSTDGQFILRGGSSSKPSNLDTFGYSDGASLYLFGKDEANAGGFKLVANNGTDDVILYGQADGTLTWNSKQLATTDDVAHLLQNNTNAQTIVGYKNSIYRGKYLGSSLTSAQSATIRAGVFDDLFIGDYWTIGGVNYRIAAFDYYYNCGDTACTTHHVVVVPDTYLYTAQMNVENVTTGAYVGSAMYTTNLNSAKTTIGNAFGTDHLLTIRQYFSNAVTNGYESGGAWTDATVWLMNEHNVYGSPVFNNCIQGTSWANRYTIDNSQYPLFAMNPRMIHTRQTYWLRDVANSTAFAFVNDFGRCDYYYSSYSFGVRPAFLVY